MKLWQLLLLAIGLLLIVAGAAPTPLQVFEAMEKAECKSMLDSVITDTDVQWYEETCGHLQLTKE